MKLLKIYMSDNLALSIKITKAHTLDLGTALLGMYPTNRLTHM